MSIIFQYMILRKILKLTHLYTQTPSAVALSYDELRIFSLLWKVKPLREFINARQRTCCCILFNMGLVEMRNTPTWKIAVSKEGALYAAELKLQIIKSIGTVLLAVFSTLFGFLLGTL